MSITTTKRRILLAYYSLLVLSLVLLLTCCILPKWWIFKYQTQKNMGTRIIYKVECGLWKACALQTNSDDICKSYNSNVVERSDKITGLNALRGFLIAAILITFVNVILGVVLFCKHSIAVLLWIIAALKFFSWLVCCLLSLCVGFSLIDKSQPSPPLWVLQTPTDTSVSVDYGWAFIVTCLLLVLSVIHVALVSFLLAVIVRFRKKLSSTETSTASSVRSDTQFKPYDMYGFEAMLQSRTNSNQTKSLESMTSYENYGYSKHKQLNTIYKGDFTNQNYGQNSDTSSSFSHQNQHDGSYPGSRQPIDATRKLTTQYLPQTSVHVLDRHEARKVFDQYHVIDQHTRRGQPEDMRKGRVNEPRLIVFGGRNHGYPAPDYE